VIHRRSQARGLADCAVDVCDDPAGPADDMVVVIADPRLVAGDRARRLNAPQQTGVCQCSQDVVDGLPGHFGKIGAYRTKDGVGIGVGVGVHRIENCDARTGYPKVGVSQLISEIRRGWHISILSRFLE